MRSRVDGGARSRVRLHGERNTELETRVPLLALLEQLVIFPDSLLHPTLIATRVPPPPHSGNHLRDQDDGSAQC